MNEHHDEFRDRIIREQRFQCYFDDNKSINENASLHILHRSERENQCEENRKIIDQSCMKITRIIEYDRFRSRITIHFARVKNDLSNTQNKCQVINRILFRN